MNEPNLEAFEYYCKKFKRTFRFEERFTPWHCPHCRIGRLIAKQESFIKTNKQVFLDAEEAIYSFSGNFDCDTCHNKTSTIGNGAIRTCYDLDSETGQCHEWEDETCLPTFFSPQVSLFQPVQGTPASVVNALNRSFMIAWMDISASCNILRTVVEKLFNEKWPDIKGKTLHRKIEALQMYSVDDPISMKVCTYLTAIKFLGNEASHDDVLEERDLAVAFELIEQILITLYDSRQQKLDVWAKMVTDAKGRPIK